jgi:hypothetical protein
MLLAVAGLLLSLGQAQVPPPRRYCDDRRKATRPVVEDLRAGREIPVAVEHGLPPFHFHIVADPDCGGIRKVEVRTAAGLLLQTLTLEESEAPYIGSKFFATEDLNFDGFLDVMCLRSWGVTGNESYSIWLFNPSTRQFEPSVALSALVNPKANAKTHEITSSSVGGMAAHIYERATYKWRAGHLVLLSSEHQGWDPKARCFVRISEQFGGPRPKKTRKVVCDPDWQ